MNFFLKKSISGGGKSFFTLALIIFGAVLAAYPLDPNRGVSQFKREKWGTEEGFAGGTIYAITQTRDGYLWIGCDKGLIRFDGINFQPVRQQVLMQPLNEPVLGLIADDDGALWIRLGRLAVLRYRDGKFSIVTGEDGQPIAGVTAMSRAAGGKILISTLQSELFENQFDNVFKLVTPSGAAKPFINAMLKTPSGDVWLGTRDSGLVRIRGGEIAAFAANLPDVKINCLLSDGERGLWVGTDKGLARWNGEQLSVAGVPEALENVQILTILKDRDQNIWLGTDKFGLTRMNANGLVAKDVDDVQEANQPSAVTTLFEDREGNLWTGGAQGLERLRDSAFTTYLTAQGLPSDQNGPIYADADNRLWFAPLAGGLYWLRASHVEKVTADGLAGDIVYSITGDGRDLWVGRRNGGLTRLHYDGDVLKAKTYTPADGLAQASIYAVHLTRDGTLWTGTLSGGAGFFKNGVFTNFTTASGLASNTIAAIAQTQQGTIWFATPTGLSSFDNGVWRTLTVKDGLPSDNIISLLADSSGGLWVGTAKGLAFIDSSGLVLGSSPDRAAKLDDSIFGIAEDGVGGLWVSTPGHVLRIGRDAFLTNQSPAEDIREFNPGDGLKSNEGIKRSQTVVADFAGRIWFSLSRGISMVDAKRLKTNPIPALIQIQSISVDGADLELTGDLKLPPAGQRIILAYAGLSLTIPERVKFRYYLEGFDRDWGETTGDREAVYTNLSAGTYVFHVVACNSDGVWNSPEATLRLTIEPAYWQTWWFRLLCAAVALLGIFGFYRLRLRRVTGELNARFEERLAERTRIARELHDSLLQGVVSASLQLNVAVDNLPDEAASKPQFNRIVELMGQVTREGRNTLRGLRSPTEESPVNFEQLFFKLADDFKRLEKPDFQIIVEGAPQSLDPAICEEAYRIGREALLNAARHSNAGRIEIRIEYLLRALRITVSDDGRGIEREILQNGREGHWGLAGMRERAAKIGARFKIQSRADAGTEVELSIPNRIALNRSPAARLFGWLSGLPRRHPKAPPKEKRK